MKTPADFFPPADYIREFVEGRGWSVQKFADELHWPLPRTRELLEGKRLILRETALDLARVFGTSTALWLNLEAAWQSRP